MHSGMYAADPGTVMPEGGDMPEEGGTTPENGGAVLDGDGGNTVPEDNGAQADAPAEDAAALPATTEGGGVVIGGAVG